MLQFKEKIVRNIIVNLDYEDIVAIARVHDLVSELEDTIKHLEIVSPYTGQIFEDIDIIDTLDLLKTLNYYDMNKKEIKFIEPED